MMFKKAFILMALLLLSTTVFSVRLVEPISKEIFDEDYVGSASPGSQLELIFSKELGKYDSLKMLNSLPEGFNVEIEDYIDSIKLFIDVEENVLRQEYFLDLELTGENKKKFSVYFLVEDGLLDVSLKNYSSKTKVNGEAGYKFILINNSDSKVDFYLEPVLPSYWIKEDKRQVVSVSKQSVTEKEVIIIPPVEGEHFFDVVVEMSYPENKKTFSLGVLAEQTFMGKLKTIQYGFPFYSFSLLPNYFFNSLLASLF